MVSFTTIDLIGIRDAELWLLILKIIKSVF